MTDICAPAAAESLLEGVCLKHLGWLAFAGVALSAFSGALGGSSQRDGEPDKPRAKARLIAEHDALAPGQTAYLGFTFDIEPGWHLYWDGAGDTGMPVHVEATLPPGFRAGELLWPAPKRHISSGDLLDYIYEDRVTLLLPITVPESAAPGEPIMIGASLDWLECRDYCLPGSARVEITLPVTDAPPAKSPDAKRFDEARRRLPRPLPDTGSPVELTWKGTRLNIHAPGAASLAFYPKSASMPMVRPIEQGAADADVLSIEFEPRGENDRAVGVLEVARAKGPSEIYAIDLPAPDAR